MILLAWQQANGCAHTEEPHDVTTYPYLSIIQNPPAAIDLEIAQHLAGRGENLWAFNLALGLVTPFAAFIILVHCPSNSLPFVVAKIGNAGQHIGVATAQGEGSLFAHDFLFSSLNSLSSLWKSTASIVLDA